MLLAIGPFLPPSSGAAGVIFIPPFSLFLRRWSSRAISSRLTLLFRGRRRSGMAEMRLRMSPTNAAGGQPAPTWWCCCCHDCNSAKNGLSSHYTRGTRSVQTLVFFWSWGGVSVLFSFSPHEKGGVAGEGKGETNLLVIWSAINLEPFLSL